MQTAEGIQIPKSQFLARATSLYELLCHNVCIIYVCFMFVTNF